MRHGPAHFKLSVVTHTLVSILVSNFQQHAARAWFFSTGPRKSSFCDTEQVLVSVAATRGGYIPFFLHASISASEDDNFLLLIRFRNRFLGPLSEINGVYFFCAL